MFTRAQDRAARVAGIDPASRSDLVQRMVEPPAGDRVSYWLQLALSVVIAVLGLALGSAAVVIGAMLISPLMQPLVELGMGLAIGSTVLVVRAGLRTVGSVVLAIGGAAAVTWLLPFHDVNAELTARTSPTLIDLFIAGACALAAVYTTVRQTSDTTSAAAGTAIGISLVPPLCTAGYGVGTGDWTMAMGASLLFTANLSAILALAAIVLVLFGYGQVDIATLESSTEAGGTNRARRVAMWSRRRMSRLGMASRLFLPVLLVALVFFPLRSALEEVAWEVRARDEVSRVLDELHSDLIVQQVRVSRKQVALRLLWIGTQEDAAAAGEKLRRDIAHAIGTDPTIDLMAVPDADALDAMAMRFDRAVAVATRPRPAPTPTAALGAVAAELRRAWPAEAAGPILQHGAEVTDSGIGLRVLHLGAALGAAGETILERALSRTLGVVIDVTDVALPARPIEAEARDGAIWATEALAAMLAAERVPGLYACVDLPEDAPPPAGARRKRRAPRPVVDAAIREQARALAARSATATVRMTTSTWRLALQLTPCEAAAPAD